jgi:hypothetical protein
MASELNQTLEGVPAELFGMPLSSSSFVETQLPYLITLALGIVIYAWLGSKAKSNKSSNPSIPAGPRGLPILGMYLICRNSNVFCQQWTLILVKTRLLPILDQVSREDTGSLGKEVW